MTSAPRPQNLASEEKQGAWLRVCSRKSPFLPHRVFFPVCHRNLVLFGWLWTQLKGVSQSVSPSVVPGLAAPASPGSLVEVHSWGQNAEGGPSNLFFSKSPGCQPHVWTQGWSLPVRCGEISAGHFGEAVFFPFKRPEPGKEEALPRVPSCCSARSPACSEPGVEDSRRKARRGDVPVTWTSYHLPDCD